jgi:hypothetical protein
MHPLYDYVAKQLAEKLKSRRIVVWYHERGEFHSSMRCAGVLVNRASRQLTPIQIATFDLEEYRRVRTEFTCDARLVAHAAHD